MAEKRERVLRVGIASVDFVRARTLAIAAGRRKRLPHEPLVWFTSMQGLAQVLSEPNRALLELIRKVRPATLTELAAISGRAPGNLSRTLKTMAGFRLVRLENSGRSVRPVVDWYRIDIAVPLAEAA